MRKLLTAIALTVTLSAPAMANDAVGKIKLCDNMAGAYAAAFSAKQTGLPKSFILQMVEDTNNPTVIAPMRQAVENIYSGAHDGQSEEEVRELAFDKCIEAQFK